VTGTFRVGRWVVFPEAVPSIDAVQLGAYETPYVRLFQCFLIVAGAVCALGCNPTRVSSAEANAILTIFDRDFEYSKARTFALGAEVSDLCLTEGEVEAAEGGASGTAGAGGDGGESDPRFDEKLCVRHEDSLDDDIFDALADSMEQSGYRQVDADEEPDVIVLASAVARSYWFYASGYNICDPVLGSECWDPGTGYDYTLPYGALLLTFIDGQELEKGKVESAWLATIPQVFGPNGTRGSAGGIQAAIDQAFAQSTYLEVDP
jgi:hypothetical protein